MNNESAARTLFSSGVEALDRGDFASAVSYFIKTLACLPDNIPTLSNLMFCYFQQKEFSDAINIANRILLIDQTNIEALEVLALSYKEGSQTDLSLEAFDRILSLDGDNVSALNNKGVLLKILGRHQEAIQILSRALSLQPMHPDALINIGNSQRALKCYDEALAAYDQALSIKPDLEGAWVGRGNVHTDLKRHDEALAAYDKALAINPDLEGVQGARLQTKITLCKWDNLDREIARLLDAIRAGKANSNPFTPLALSDSPDDHLKCAKAWIAAKHPQPSKSIWNGEVYNHKKIRLGYVSPDFRQHPVAHLAAGLFESHDRDRFETYAFSIGPNDRSDLRQRLTNAFDYWLDLYGRSDSEILDKIKAAEIDIMIDLAGDTRDSRLSLFVSRPAPIAVNFLGFPGTLGNKNAWDYIIADQVVVPDENKRFFEEKTVWLPGSFMPRDSKTEMRTDQKSDRSDFALPENAIVFCCFNNAHKFNPSTFDCWTRILKAVDRSVLWLTDTIEEAKSNLRKEAEKRDINADRLIFAKRVPSSSEHLARHRLADLFLDTLPYNAHTTANDALWAGLPVLTQIGKSFAGRTAASLLTAVGLPELITHSREEYEALAIDLALNKQKLEAVREKLQRSRLTTPLFDTALHTKHLEAAYEAIYRRHQANLPPDHIEVRPIQ